MDHLALLSIPSTSLSLLSDGIPTPLLDEMQMDLISVPLIDQEDITTFGLDNLCFLTWVSPGGSVMSTPLLSGSVLIRQHDGYLLLLQPKKIYKINMPLATPETHEIFLRLLAENAAVNKPQVGLPLAEQLEYIYGDETLPEDTIVITKKEDLTVVSVADRAGDYFVKGSIALRDGIVSTADHAGRGILYGKSRYIETTEKKGEYEVSENVKKSFEVVATTSKGVAKVTKVLLDAAGTALVHAGTYAVNQVQKQQEKSGKQPSEELKAAGRFFIKSAQAVGNIMDGVVEGAEIVVGDASTSAVEIAHHKYGTQVGHTTKSGIEAITHTATAVTQVATFSKPSKFIVAVSQNAGGKLCAAQDPNSPSADSPEGISPSPSSRSLTSVASNPHFTQLPSKVAVTKPPPYTVHPDDTASRILSGGASTSTAPAGSEQSPPLYTETE